jgi:hypothetical protein
MKKLLLTSALVGSTLLASNAIAQTTVTGNLNISYKAVSFDKATDQIKSGRGFGNEQQINISNKGKLNNGMDYVAGFSIENDGAQTGSVFGENTYIDFISGNTLVSFGEDHIQNADRTLGAGIGMEAADLVLANGATGIFITDEMGNNISQGFGAAIVQTIPGIGKLSALYVPTKTEPNSTSSDKTVEESTEESGYEIGFVGDFGVKGLSVHAFRSVVSDTTGDAGTADDKGTNLGVAYNFGQITAGYTYKKDGVPAPTAAAGDVKQHQYAVSFAVDPKLSLSANYTKAEKEGTSTPADAKAKTLGIGYNLGPVAVVANISKIEDYSGVAGNDVDVFYMALRTSF